LDKSKRESEDKFRTELTSLIKEREDMKSKFESDTIALIKARDEKEAQLKSQIDMLAKVKDETEEKLKRYITDIAHLKEQGDTESNSKISGLQKEKDDLSAKLSDLTKSKEEMENRLSLQVAELTKEKQETEARLKGDVSALINTGSRLKEEYELLTKAKKETESQLYEKMDAVEKEKSFSDSRINVLENLKAEYESKTNSSDFERKTLEDAKTALGLQLDKETLALKAAEAKLKEAESRIQDLELDKKAAARGLRREIKLSGRAQEETAETQADNIKEAAVKVVDAVVSPAEKNPEKEAKAVIATLDVPVIETGSLKVASELMVGKTSGVVIGKDAANREVWLDFSKANGIAEGQTFDVYRDNKKISALKTTKVFDSFIVTKPLTDRDFDIIQELDKVEISSK
jgi:hypothetical protein